MLVTYNTAPKYDETVSITEANITCQRAAIDFASRVGFDDMLVVWSSSADGECVVNLAPVQDGAILYPDLVKVKIRESDTTAIGLDASHYAMNHCVRMLATPTVSVESAKSAISLQNVSDGRLALIPLRETQEVLTYEFECHEDGTYYIYVDAQTGDEVNILYVIEDENGERTI